MYGEFGTFCHKLLEEYERREVEKSDLVRKYQDEFFDNVTSFSISKNDPMDKLYDYGFSYFENVNLDIEKLNPIYIEKDIHFDFHGYKFRGIIDLMYKDNDGELVILDHKTSEYPITKKGMIKKSKSETMDGYIKQLVLYAIGVEKVVGKLPKYIGWNFIRAGQTYIIPLTTEMIDETTEWALNVIRRIYETEEFEKRGGYILCNKLCDFRNSCS